MNYFFKGCQAEDLMEFSSGSAVYENPFGAVLAEIASQTYENIDESITDLTAGLIQRGFDVDEDYVYGLFSGDELPDAEILEAFEELCLTEDGQLDEDALAALYESAEASYAIEEDALPFDEEDGLFYDDEGNAYGEDTDIFVDEDGNTLVYIEDEDGEDYEDYEDGVEYEDYEDEDEYFDPETEALRSQVDELTTRQIVTDNLDSLVEYGKSLVASGCLPPVAFEALLGDAEETSGSRFAEFSSVCADEDLQPEVELEKIAFCLEVFEKCGPLMDFGNFSASDTEIDEDHDEIDDILANAMVASYRAN